MTVAARSLVREIPQSQRRVSRDLHKVIDAGARSSHSPLRPAARYRLVVCTCREYVPPLLSISFYYLKNSLDIEDIHVYDCPFFLQEPLSKYSNENHHHYCHCSAPILIYLGSVQHNYLHYYSISRHLVSHLVLAHQLYLCYCSSRHINESARSYAHTRTNDHHKTNNDNK